MRVRVVSARGLYSFLASTLPFHSFTVYAHMLSYPFLSLLTALPPRARGSSAVYLDGTRRANEAAAVELARAGYAVYMVDGLHAKAVEIGVGPDYLVVGSANLTGKSLDNIEAIVIIERPPAGVVRAFREVVARRARERARPVHPPL